MFIKEKGVMLSCGVLKKDLSYGHSIHHQRELEGNKHFAFISSLFKMETLLLLSIFFLSPISTKHEMMKQILKKRILLALR